MSKSDENTNELDSYGVWVKNTPGKDQSQLDDQVDNLGIDNTEDSGLDLPDFEDTDTEFSDMFKDEPQFSVDEQEDDFGNDLDSTLSTDELANITGLGDVAIENVDAAPIVDDFTSSDSVFDDLGVADSDNTLSDELNNSTVDDISDIEKDFVDDGVFDSENSVDISEVTDDFEMPDDTLVSDVNFAAEDTLATDDNLAADDDFITDDSFGSDDTLTTDDSFAADDTLATDDSFAADDTFAADDVSSEENSDDSDDFFKSVIEEPSDSSDQAEAPEAVDVSDTFEASESAEGDGEQEISLDDFMDGGFSDESVAAGNNGYEPGAEKPVESSGATEEIALDDFLDADSFESITSDKKDEASIDEAPINMDISFDDSVDSVETEENSSLEDGIVYDTDDEVIDDYSDSENIDIDAEDDTIIEDSQENSFEGSFVDNNDNNVDIDTEEIDLSDFGIDSEAEETPIVQDVEDEKNKEKVVDYDLFVVNDTPSSAPIVNEIKDEKVEDIEEVIEEPTNTTTVDNTLLEQIVADLSSLKDEINNIKTNIAEIQSKELKDGERDFDDFDKTEDSDETIDNVDITEETTTDDIPMPDVVVDDELENNFEDTDATIADMAEDEVQNEETAIATDETVADVDVNEETTTDDIPMPDFVDDDIFVNDESDITENIDIPEDNDEGGFFSADDTDDTIALSGDELSNIMNNAEFSDSLDFEEENNSGIVSDEEEIKLPEETTDDLGEPTFENMAIDEDFGDDQFYTEMPDEIEIPKDDDIFVASTSSDFMDSVKDTTEEMESEAETLEEPDEMISDIEDIPEEIEIDNFEEPEEAEIVEDSAEVTEEFDNDENQDIPTVEKILEEDISADETEESFGDVDFLNNENAEEDITQASNEESMEEEEISFDDVDFLNNNVESVEEPADTDNTDEAEITFDDVDFLNNTATEETAIADDSSSDVTEETTFEPIDEETAETPFMSDDDFAADNQVVTEEEPFIAETAIDEAETVEDDKDSSADAETYLEVDNLDNNLSKSNIAYLTKEDENTDKDSSNLNGDLKQEIKSVLLYMDQLLESLPDDKICEFAKSEEFTTYKKLFKDLGLS